MRNNLPPHFTVKAETRTPSPLRGARTPLRGPPPAAKDLAPHAGQGFSATLCARAEQQTTLWPPPAFLLGNKVFDFLLTDLSFYFQDPPPLTHGASISEPLKSNFPHGAPKRLTNFQRIIRFLSGKSASLSLSFVFYSLKCVQEHRLSALLSGLSPHLPAGEQSEARAVGLGAADGPYCCGTTATWGHVPKDPWSGFAFGEAGQEAQGDLF